MPLYMWITQWYSVNINSNMRNTKGKKEVHQKYTYFFLVFPLAMKSGTSRIQNRAGRWTYRSHSLYYQSQTSNRYNEDA